MVENTKLQSALENKTDFSEVSIEGDNDEFVYAMVTDDTGMKFELPLSFTQDPEKDDVAYMVWKNNDIVKQAYLSNDLDALVSKANTIYTTLTE